ncbi:hypothetical protein GN330_16695 [Nitratireductor sp. CAU 1489]|uniref:Uncharacterized protein n=1 Tax=Nitratireductor arenosus TaxID=2682096 RepID=A0A844QLG6_9HYPH|nr:hypothetical protein [Nitratireductor arenosus]MVA98888.1 hypothetical protein [Nitratireductor arenosus]
MTRALPLTQREGQSSHRRRVSASAVRETLKAIQDTGLIVDKVCIAGGQVEITCHPIENHPTPENDGGLKEW